MSPVPRRRLLSVGLSVLLLGCSGAPPREPAPSGESLYLSSYGDECGGGWFEGLLRNPEGGLTELHFSPGTVDWPERTKPQASVQVLWPENFTAVRLDGGEMAVVDGSGNVAAMTGRKYRLRGALEVGAPAGGPDFGTGEGSFLAGFRACGDPDSVIPL